MTRRGMPYHNLSGERSELTWTTEKPRQPGWYWHKQGDYNGGKPEVCRVFQDDHGGELRVLWTLDCPFADCVSEYDGQWSGPLEPPREETT